MKKLITYLTQSGEEYEIPEDKEQAFLKDFSAETPKRVYGYRANGEEYAIPEDKVNEFVNTFKDAQPTETMQLADGETRDFTEDELSPRVTASHANEWKADTSEDIQLENRLKLTGGTLIDTDHRNRPMRINRDDNGKINSYSTTASTIVRAKNQDDEDTFFVVPTIWEDENGKMVSAKNYQEAEEHFNKTGQTWGGSQDLNEAKQLAQDVHNYHQKIYQKDWNEYLHQNWDDVSDNIVLDPEMRKAHNEWFRKKAEASLPTGIPALGIIPQSKYKDGEIYRDYKDGTPVRYNEKEDKFTPVLLPDSIEYNGETLQGFTPSDKKGQELYQKVKKFKGQNIDLLNQPVYAELDEKTGNVKGLVNDKPEVMEDPISGKFFVVPGVWKEKNGKESVSVKARPAPELSNNHKEQQEEFDELAHRFAPKEGETKEEKAKREEEWGKEWQKVNSKLTHEDYLKVADEMDMSGTAQEHYQMKRKKYGEFDTREEAENAAKDIEELYKDVYQTKNTLWLFEHWDDLDDSLKTGELSAMHDKWVADGSKGIVLPQLSDEEIRIRQEKAMRLAKQNGEMVEMKANEWPEATPMGPLEYQKESWKAQTGREYSTAKATMLNVMPYAGDFEKAQAYKADKIIGDFASGNFDWQNPSEDALQEIGLTPEAYKSIVTDAKLTTQNSRSAEEKVKKAIKLAAEIRGEEVLEVRSAAEKELTRPMGVWATIGAKTIENTNYVTGLIGPSIGVNIAAKAITRKMASNAMAKMLTLYGTKRGINGVAGELTRFNTLLNSSSAMFVPAESFAIEQGLRTLEIIAGGIPNTISGGVRRSAELNAPDFTYNGDNEFEIVYNGYDALRSGIQGAVGSAVENIGVEGLTDGIVDVGLRGIARLPVAGAIINAWKKTKGKITGKMMNSSLGRAALWVGNAYDTLSQITNFNSYPVEHGEELIQPWWDECIGLGLKKDEECKNFAQYLKDNLTLKNQCDIFLGLAGTMLVQGGGAVARAAAWRYSDEGKQYEEGVRSARSILEDLGVDKKVLGVLTDKQLFQTMKAYSMLCRNPKLAETFASTMDEAAKNCYSTLLAGETWKAANGELKDFGIDVPKFKIRTQKGADGKAVPVFTKIEMVDPIDGTKSMKDAMVDPATGIAIIDNGKKTHGTNEAFTIYDTNTNGMYVHVKDRNGHTSVMKMAGAYKAGSIVDAMNIANLHLAYKTAEEKLPDAKDNVKTQIIDNMIAKNFAGMKDKIHQFRTMDDALAWYTEQTGKDLTKDPNFKPDRMGFHMPDGSVVLVRDNFVTPQSMMSSIPSEIIRVLRHESIGHSSTMNDVIFFDANENSQMGRLRDENLEAKKAKYENGEESPFAPDAPSEESVIDTILRESGANTIQSRAHTPTFTEKIIAGVRRVARKANPNLRVSDAEIEVVAAKVEKAAREGTPEAKAEAEKALQRLDPKGGYAKAREGKIGVGDKVRITTLDGIVEGRIIRQDKDTGDIQYEVEKSRKNKLTNKVETYTETHKGNIKNVVKVVESAGTTGTTSETRSEETPSPDTPAPDTSTEAETPETPSPETPKPEAPTSESESETTEGTEAEEEDAVFTDTAGNTHKMRGYVKPKDGAYGIGARVIAHVNDGNVTGKITSMEGGIITLSDMDGNEISVPKDDLIGIDKNNRGEVKAEEKAEEKPEEPKPEAKKVPREESMTDEELMNRIDELEDKMYDYTIDENGKTKRVDKIHTPEDENELNTLKAEQRRRLTKAKAEEAEAGEEGKATPEASTEEAPNEAPKTETPAPEATPTPTPETAETPKQEETSESPKAEETKQETQETKPTEETTNETGNVSNEEQAQPEQATQSGPEAGQAQQVGTQEQGNVKTETEEETPSTPSTSEASEAENAAKAKLFEAQNKLTEARQTILDKGKSIREYYSNKIQSIRDGKATVDEAIDQIVGKSKNLPDAARAALKNELQNLVDAEDPEKALDNYIILNMKRSSNPENQKLVKELTTLERAVKQAEKDVKRSARAVKAEAKQAEQGVKAETPKVQIEVPKTKEEAEAKRNEIKKQLVARPETNTMREYIKNKINTLIKSEDISASDVANDLAGSKKLSKAKQDRMKRRVVRLVYFARHNQTEEFENELDEAILDDIRRKGAPEDKATLAQLRACDKVIEANTPKRAKRGNYLAEKSIEAFAQTDESLGILAYAARRDADNNVMGLFKLPLNADRQRGTKYSGVGTSDTISDDVIHLLDGYGGIHYSKSGKLNLGKSAHMPKELRYIFGNSLQIGSNDTLIDVLNEGWAKPGVLSDDMSGEDIIALLDKDKKNYERWCNRKDAERFAEDMGLPVEYDVKDMTDEQRYYWEQEQAALADELQIGDEVYSLDELEARSRADEAYNNAWGEVDKYDGGNEVITAFSRDRLRELKPGDQIQFDHTGETFEVVSYDAENDVLTLEDWFASEDEWSKTGKDVKIMIQYQVSQDGIAEIRKDTEENGQENEAVTTDDGTSNAQGERGENSAENAEGTQSGATSEEVVTEEVSEAEEAEDAPKPSTISAEMREKAKAAQKALKADAMLSDAELEAKAKAWRRHPDALRQSRAQAAEDLLAYRRATAAQEAKLVDDTPQAAVAQAHQAEAKQGKPQQAKQGLTLESKTQEELDAERAKAKQDAAIKERPIKGSADEFGQQQFGLGDTNGDLFNPVVPNEAKEKAENTTPQVAARIPKVATSVPSLEQSDKILSMFVDKTGRHPINNGDVLHANGMAWATDGNVAFLHADKRVKSDDRMVSFPEGMMPSKHDRSVMTRKIISATTLWKMSKKALDEAKKARLKNPSIEVYVVQNEKNGQEELGFILTDPSKTWTHDIIFSSITKDQFRTAKHIGMLNAQKEKNIAKAFLDYGHDELLLSFLDKNEINRNCVIIMQNEDGDKVDTALMMPDIGMRYYYSDSGMNKALKEYEEKRGGSGAVSFDSPEMQKRDEQIRREYDAVVAAYTNADGTKKPTWMKTPNGKKTKLTERQWVQVRTPAFKAWFGDWENDPANASKVVDANGEPIVVYHGSPNFFHAFKNSGGKYYFMRKESLAKQYEARRNMLWISDSPSANTYGCFINLKNPGIIDAHSKYNRLNRGMVKHALGLETNSSEFMVKRSRGFMGPAENEIDVDEACDYAKKAGKDGLIILQVADNMFENNYLKTDEYIAFSPNQIKSATDNIGSFDSSSDDINWDSPELARPKDERDYESMQRFKSALRKTLNQIDWDTPEMGRKAKDKVRATLRKSRPDLDEQGVEDAVNEIAKFENTKERRAAAWWLSKGTIRLPQDMLKVKQAIEIGEASRARVEGMKKVITEHEATIKAAEENLAAQTDERKIERAQRRLENAEERYQEASDLVPQSEGVGYEPFNYDSPMEMMDALHKFKPRGKPINPDTVPYLSDKRDMGHGVVTYLVDESRESQQAMREIINTHWGEDANPWCLLQGDGKGNLNDGSNGDYDAWQYWNQYSALPKRVAFKNGKLLAFMATEGNGEEYVAGDTFTEYLDYALDGTEYEDEYRAWVNELEEQGEDSYVSFEEWMQENYPEVIQDMHEEARREREENAEEEWWDYRDKAHSNIPYGDMKVPNDLYGRWGHYELIDGEIVRVGEYEKGIRGKEGYRAWARNGILVESIEKGITRRYHNDTFAPGVLQSYNNLLDGLEFQTTVSDGTVYVSTIITTSWTYTFSKDGELTNSDTFHINGITFDEKSGEYTYNSGGGFFSEVKLDRDGKLISIAPSEGLSANERKTRESTIAATGEEYTRRLLLDHAQSARHRFIASQRFIEYKAKADRILAYEEAHNPNAKWIEDQKNGRSGVDFDSPEMARQVDFSTFIGELGAKKNEAIANDLKVAMDALGDRDWNKLTKEEKRKIGFATGWEKGADGKWRHEWKDLDREKIEKELYPKIVDNLKHRRVTSMTLGDFLSPELKEAYPELASIAITCKTNSGGTTWASWDTAKNKITIYPITVRIGVDSFVNSMTHEIQHAIQRIEGFATGSNAKYEEELLRSELGFDYKDIFAIFQKAYDLRETFSDTLGTILAPYANQYAQGVLDESGDTGKDIARVVRSTLANSDEVIAFGDKHLQDVGATPFSGETLRGLLEEVVKTNDKFGSEECVRKLLKGNLSESTWEKLAQEINEKCGETFSELVEATKKGKNLNEEYYTLSAERGRENYHRSAGEVEARNAASREYDATNKHDLIEDTEDVPRSEQIVRFDSPEMTSTTEKFNGRKSAERRKDLVALHNVSKESIKDILALGGFAMPSIAIVKDAHGHSSYGDVTVLFGRETIDPKKRKENKIYSHDAWTPTFPEVSLKIDMDKVRATNMRLAEMVPEDVRKIFNWHEWDYERFEDDGITRAFNHLKGGNDAAVAYGGDEIVKAAYLISKGEKVEVVDNNSYKTEEALRARVDINDPAYKAWVNEQYGDVVLARGIRNEKDWYTPDGTRRKWDELYDPVTLDKAVEMMKTQQNEQGEDGIFGPDLFGAAAKKYSSIPEVVRNEGKLKQIPWEEMNALEEKIADDFSGAKEEFIRTKAGGLPDVAEEIIFDAWNNSRQKFAAFKKGLNTQGYSADEELAKELYGILQEASEIDTTYFEAKPQRAVRIDEAKAWIVPDTIDAADKAALEARGQEVHTYKEKDEADRLRVVNEVANERRILFDSPEMAEKANSFARAEYEAARAKEKLANPDVQTVMDMSQGKWETTRVLFQDAKLPILALEKELEKRTGHALNKKDSIYYAKDFEFGKNEYELTVLQKKRIDPIFKKMMEYGLTQEAVDMYLTARHAPYRNAVLRGRGATDGSGMSDADAARILQEFTRMGMGDQLAEIADMVYTMNNEALERRVKSGRIDEETAANLRATLMDYVPLRNNNENKDMDSFNTYSSGWHHNEFRQAKGRSTLADSPLAWSIVQAERAIKDANLNETMQVAARFARASEAAGMPIGKIIPGRKVSGRWVFSLANTKFVAGPDGIGRFGGDTGFFYEDIKDSPDLIFFKEDGKLMAIQVDEGKEGYGIKFAKAVTDKDFKHLPDWLTWMGHVTRFMSAVRTQYVPTFIFRNLKADFTEVLLNRAGEIGAGLDMAKFMKDFVASEAQNLKNVRRWFKYGEADGYVKEYVENGGLIGGGMVAEGFTEAQKRLADSIKAYQMGKAKKAGKVLLDGIGLMNACAEYTTRIGVYSALRKEGWSIEDAISYARDATTNFNRKGTLTTILNSFYMFSNAAIQGMSRSFKSMRSKHGVQTLVGLMLLGALEAWLNNMFGGGDDDDDDGKSSVKNITEYEKQNTIGIPIGRDKRLKTTIRMPWAGSKYLGYKMMELMLNWDKDGEATKIGKDLLGALSNFVTDPVGGNGFGSMSEFLQTLSPTATDPLVQWATGKDYKGENRLKRNFNDNAPDSWNGRENTPEIYKWIAQSLNAISGGDQYEKGAFDTSPENWKLAAETVLGGIMTDLNRLISTGENVYQWIREGEKPEKTLREIPFVRDTISQAPDISNKYYEMMGMQESAAYKLKKMENDDAVSVEAYDAFEAKHPWGSDEELKDLKKEIKELTENERSAETTKESREIHDEKLQAMANFVKRMNELRREVGRGSEEE